MSIFDPAPVAVLLSCGLFVGFAQGFLGIGGSFIMVPVTLIVFQWIGVPAELGVKLAFGTSLAVVFPAALSSVLAHNRRGKVWWRAVISFGLAASAGALVGSTLTARYLPGDALIIAFGAVLLLVAVSMLTGRPPRTQDTPKSQVPLWVLSGSGIGLTSGLIGIGGGILTVPIMTMGFQFGVLRAIGTSTGIMVFTSGAGALGYIINGLFTPGLPELSLGLVHVPTWSMLAVTSVTTTVLGARLAHRVSARVLVTVFSVLMTYLGLRMIGAFDWLGLPL